MYVSKPVSEITPKKCFELKHILTTSFLSPESFSIELPNATLVRISMRLPGSVGAHGTYRICYMYFLSSKEKNQSACRTIPAPWNVILVTGAYFHRLLIADLIDSNASPIGKSVKRDVTSKLASFILSMFTPFSLSISSAVFLKWVPLIKPRHLLSGLAKT